MEQEKCFNIDGKDIWLDQILIDFNEIPLLFICFDADKNYYAVLCTDIDNMQYIIVPQRLDNISKMLHQRISMRELFIISKWFWKVQAKDDLSDDVVVKKSIEELDAGILPKESAVFKIFTKDLEDYRDSIDNRLLAEVMFEPCQFDVDIEDDFSEYDIIQLIQQVSKITIDMESKSERNTLINYTDFELGKPHGSKEFLKSKFCEESTFICDYEIHAA